MTAPTDIVGSGVVARVSDLREIAAQVAAVKKLCQIGCFSRENSIALARRCRRIDELLQLYLQLRLEFHTAYCPSCGQDLRNRRF